jgi:hypothetical protein
MAVAGMLWENQMKDIRAEEEEGLEIDCGWKRGRDLGGRVAVAGMLSENQKKDIRAEEEEGLEIDCGWKWGRDLDGHDVGRGR